MTIFWAYSVLGNTQMFLWNLILNVEILLDSAPFVTATYRYGHGKTKICVSRLDFYADVALKELVLPTCASYKDCGWKSAPNTIFTPWEDLRDICNYLKEIVTINVPFSKNFWTRNYNYDLCAECGSYTSLSLEQFAKKSINITAKQKGTWNTRWRKSTWQCFRADFSQQIFKRW